MEPDYSQFWFFQFSNEKAFKLINVYIHTPKCLLITKKDFDKIVYWELQKQKCTITIKAYICMRLIWRSVLPNNSKKHLRTLVPFHNDAAHVVKDFLEQQKINIWSQPAFLADISLLDFDCLCQIKKGAFVESTIAKFGEIWNKSWRCN